MKRQPLPKAKNKRKQRTPPTSKALKAAGKQSKVQKVDEITMAAVGSPSTRKEPKTIKTTRTGTNKSKKTSAQTTQKKATTSSTTTKEKKIKKEKVIQANHTLPDCKTTELPSLQGRGGIKRRGPAVGSTVVVRVARDEWKEATVRSYMGEGRLNFKYTDKDNAGKGGIGCVAKLLVRGSDQSFFSMGQWDYRRYQDLPSWVAEPLVPSSVPTSGVPTEKKINLRKVGDQASKHWSKMLGREGARNLSLQQGIDVNTATNEQITKMNKSLLCYSMFDTLQSAAASHGHSDPEVKEQSGITIQLYNNTILENSHGFMQLQCNWKADKSKDRHQIFVYARITQIKSERSPETLAATHATMTTQKKECRGGEVCVDLYMDTKEKVPTAPLTCPTITKTTKIIKTKIKFVDLIALVPALYSMSTGAQDNTHINAKKSKNIPRHPIYLARSNGKYKPLLTQAAQDAISLRNQNPTLKQKNNSEKEVVFPKVEMTEEDWASLAAYSAPRLVQEIGAHLGTKFFKLFKLLIFCFLN